MIAVRILFPLMSWEQIDGIWPNFARSRLGLLRINLYNRVMSLDREQIDWIWPNFAYALMLTGSRLGLLCVSFHKFIKELWPLIDGGILFPLNILRTNWWSLTRFCICIDIDKLQVGIVRCQFSQINYRVMALDWCQNFISAQYLENKLMEFDQNWHMHLYWEDGNITHHFR